MYKMFVFILGLKESNKNIRNNSGIEINSSVSHPKLGKYILILTSHSLI